MSDYQLQTELNDEMKRAIVLHSEKTALETEIRDYKQRVSKSLIKSGKVLTFLILFEIVLISLFQRPADFLVVTVYGLAYIAEIIWLSFGLRKTRKKLADWETAAENELQY